MVGGVLLLIVILFLVNKFSNGSVEKLNANKYISVIEKTPISKDTMLMVVKIGEDGVVLIHNPNHTEVVKTLGLEAIAMIEKKKSSNKEKGLVLDKTLCELNNFGVLSKLSVRKKV